ncbi:DivIVA domain-containing protein [Adlercreutzia sp. ZJ138]|uniref:DivIVA domain-containing protein n=1 Tax=Adlercreutzia sp. ZJ138 TaxID=2709405 RepID=UPI0013EBF975|nr:DivIVA domain-containing protein [Adlercreutzia sp. ZJ138]
MAITAEDIHNQSFSIDRKGYDVDEVDVFLERVADEIDQMNGLIAHLEDQLENSYVEDENRFDGFDTPATIEPLEEEVEVVEEVAPVAVEVAPAAPVVSESEAEKDARIAELERQLAEKRADDNAISQALIIAQRSADEIIANAKGEAADIVANARAERDRILDKAEIERQKVQDAISQLEDSREEIRGDYQDMLTDFITDASRRLAEIGGTNPLASAHARLTPARADVEPELPALATGQAPIADAPVAYTVPQATAGVIPAAATPVASVVEKDFSGFGDADDFEFDEID